MENYNEINNSMQDMSLEDMLNLLNESPGLSSTDVMKKFPLSEFSKITITNQPLTNSFRFR